VPNHRAPDEELRSEQLVWLGEHGEPDWFPRSSSPGDPPGLLAAGAPPPETAARSLRAGCRFPWYSAAAAHLVVVAGPAHGLVSNRVQISRSLPQNAALRPLHITRVDHDFGGHPAMCGARDAPGRNLAERGT